MAKISQEMLAERGWPVGLNSVFGPSGLIVSYVAGFVLTLFFGCKNIDLS
ncbi:hypothetical protein IQ209_14925 [Xenorhabdus sp. BG5]|nr:hypothetical protein [Xenorhabdus sp. BG5]